MKYIDASNNNKLNIIIFLIGLFASSLFDYVHFPSSQLVKNINSFCSQTSRSNTMPGQELTDNPKDYSIRQKIAFYADGLSSFVTPTYRKFGLGLPSAWQHMLYSLLQKHQEDSIALKNFVTYP